MRLRPSGGLGPEVGNGPKTVGREASVRSCKMCRTVLNLSCDTGGCLQQLKFSLLLRQASFDELALEIRKISLENALVAGNVVAVSPQADKSFVKHGNDPLPK